MSFNISFTSSYGSSKKCNTHIKYREYLLVLVAISMISEFMDQVIV